MEGEQEAPQYVLTDGRRRNMRANRRRDTGPEVAVRSILHARGFRYRTDYRIDAGTARPRPDIVFTRQRVAVFIDGCFWHSCPEHGRNPQNNSGYWTPKLLRNRERDEAQTEALTASGWHVLRAWEHEDPAQVADRVGKAVIELRQKAQ
ncbi:MAG: very short patch repair endonuclease [Micrococcales bacterium]|nr:very short patch repair endonuclease [Micrococcales bacterium]